jgi:hypothetical protein
MERTGEAYLQQCPGYSKFEPLLSLRRVCTGPSRTFSPTARFTEGTSMKHPRQFPFWAIAILVMLLVNTAPRSFAQDRMSDKDIQSLMKNLQQDSKKFQSKFNSDIQKSPIRNTSEEKDSKTLVKRFTDQTHGMLNQFKQTKNADQALPVVLDSAGKIDKLLATTPMNDATKDAWARVKDELNTLSKQFNIKFQIGQ